MIKEENSVKGFFCGLRMSDSNDRWSCPLRTGQTNKQAIKQIVPTHATVWCDSESGLSIFPYPMFRSTMTDDIFRYKGTRAFIRDVWSLKCSDSKMLQTVVTSLLDVKMGGWLGASTSTNILIQIFWYKYLDPGMGGWDGSYHRFRYFDTNISI